MTIRIFWFFFFQPGHLETYSIKMTNRWIFYIQTAADALIQFLTIYGSWKYRKSIGYCFEEANDIIKNVYQRYNRRFSYSLSTSKYYIDILSFISKILSNLILIIASEIFDDSRSVIGILFRTVYLTALFHNNCKQVSLDRYNFYESIDQSINFSRKKLKINKIKYVR